MPGLLSLDVLISAACAWLAIGLVGLVAPGNTRFIARFLFPLGAAVGIAVGVLALASLGGSVGQGAKTFVWGLPFFYGRAVYTSIWGQALSATGPWYAF